MNRKPQNYIALDSKLIYTFISSSLSAENIGIIRIYA